MSSYASNADLIASLQKRRAEAIATIAAAEKAKALVEKIDALLAAEDEIVKDAQTALLVAKFPVEPEATEKAHAAPKGFGVRGEGYPAKVLAVLKAKSPEPVQAREVVNEIVKGMDPPPTGKARRKIDTSVRNAISNAYQDPTSGVEKVSFGYYRWTEPKAKEAPA